MQRSFVLEVQAFPNGSLSKPRFCSMFILSVRAEPMGSPRSKLVPGTTNDGFGNNVGSCSRMRSCPLVVVVVVVLGVLPGVVLDVVVVVVLVEVVVVVVVVVVLLVVVVGVVVVVVVVVKLSKGKGPPRQNEWDPLRAESSASKHVSSVSPTN